MGIAEVLGVVLVFHDVTEQRRQSGEMRYRATHDALTGLLNRSELESHLRRLLEQVSQTESDHVLLYIDLDQFKLVNDACGHVAGDLLLQRVAKLFAETVRTRDTLARLGGDEFAKIDGQFIKGLVEEPLHTAAVRCFVEVARVVGVKTVAEFVDRPEVLTKLRELGVDYAQGYLLHRPAPLETLLPMRLPDSGHSSHCRTVDGVSNDIPA